MTSSPKKKVVKSINSIQLNSILDEMMTKLKDFIIINKTSRIDKTLQRKNNNIICTHAQQISNTDKGLDTSPVK